MSRVRVRYAHASPCKSSNHAYASSTHPRHHGKLQITRTRQVRVCVAPRCHLL
ncbi:uncharacterized protein DS421_9g266490 [Arachis hypogaea]|nr:uncharacterized protein DS421_9g266490 [Arachis hypogaea]